MPVASATWSSATRDRSSKAMRTSGSGVSSWPSSVATPKARVRAASNQLSPPLPWPEPMTLSRSPRRPPIGLSGSLEPNMLTLRSLRGAAEVSRFTTLVPAGAGHALDGQGNRGARREHVEAGPQLGHGVHGRAVDSATIPRRGPGARWPGRPARPRPRRLRPPPAASVPLDARASRDGCWCRRGCRRPPRASWVGR